jgi:hypothetical protein
MTTMEKLSQEYLSSKEKEKRKKLTEWNGQIRSGIFGGSWQCSRIFGQSEGRSFELGNWRVRKYSPTLKRIEESVARKSVEKQTLEEQLKREQDIACQKEDLE